MTRSIRLAAIAALVTMSFGPAALGSPAGTAFTYQGQLDKNGSPANTSCTYQFSLWDAQSAGAQIGTTQTVTGVTIVDGLFTVNLDFGAGMFNGQARWLQIAVQCTGDGGFTTLSPRQVLNPAPYALFALGGNTGFNLPYQQAASSPGQTLFDLTNTAATGLFHAISGKTSSTTQNACGVYGEGTAATGLTSGVQGWAVNSPLGTGVVGIGAANGAYFRGDGQGADGIETYSATGYGINASSTSSDGVKGYGVHGVWGDGASSGVYGTCQAGDGVRGESSFGRGVTGGHTATTGAYSGVFGFTSSTNPNSSGVEGTSDVGQGVLGRTLGGKGVYGVASTGQGVYGTSISGQGVNGYSSQGDGVWGYSDAAFKAGVVGLTNNVSGWGGYFRNLAGGTALVADGKAVVKVLEIQGGADLVESFEAGGGAGGGAKCDAGTVVVIDEERAGRLTASRASYDHKVAGVVSGAGGIDPGIRLGQAGILAGDTPVAMAGRVYVKCTTENGPIHPGDRLTTSSTSGHAMRATDPELSDGAVIGKAMSSLDAGTGLVLVLVNLQ